MSFIVIAIIGILAGLIARAILPGKQPGGFVLTIVLGILGAVVGGWIAGLFDKDVYTSFFSLWGWLFAILGSVVVLLVYGAIFGRRRRA